MIKIRNALSCIPVERSALIDDIRDDQLIRGPPLLFGRCLFLCHPAPTRQLAYRRCITNQRQVAASQQHSAAGLSWWYSKLYNWDAHEAFESSYGVCCVILCDIPLIPRPAWSRLSHGGARLFGQKKKTPLFSVKVGYSARSVFLRII